MDSTNTINRKLISRLLRHTKGITTKVNKETGYYELTLDSNPTEKITCDPLVINDEKYLCFEVEHKLSPEFEKLYNQLISRFSRLAPDIEITFENKEEPIFTEEQEQILMDIVNEADQEVA